MKHSINEINYAMQMLREGHSRRAVSRKTGIDTKTLNRYQHLSRAEGDKAPKRKSSYTQEFKQSVINDVLNNQQTVSFVATKNALPAITVRRWIKQYQDNGEGGLTDKRNKNPDNSEEQERFYQDRALTIRIINVVLDTFKYFGTDFGKPIPVFLIEHRAFENPEFGSFLIHILHACRFTLERKDRKSGISFTDNEMAVIYNTARLILATVPYKNTRRLQAEQLLEKQETQAFIFEFIDTVPILLMADRQNTM